MSVLPLFWKPADPFYGWVGSRLGGKSVGTEVVSVEAGKSEIPGFVYVKGGTFRMGDTFGDGDSSQRPVHEVTQKEWREPMGTGPSYFIR